MRTLQLGSVTGFSWDYGDPFATEFMTTSARSKVDQGVRGNRMAASLDDCRVETPHVGDDNNDHAILGRARMACHDYATKHFYAEGTVRNLRVGEWNGLEGHPEIDRHSDEERRFVVTSLKIAARNNLPKGLNARVNRLFARSLWRCQQQRVPPPKKIPRLQAPKGSSTAPILCSRLVKLAQKAKTAKE